MGAQKILIIEDNPITRKMGRIALEGGGYVVIEAQDAKKALEIMEKEQINLVLEDLFLPDMDGVALLKKLRAMPQGSAIPIIAFSGSLTGLLEARKAKVGFTDYLVKPIGPAKMLQTIQAYLPVTPVQPVPVQTKASLGQGRSILVASANLIQNRQMQIRLNEIGFKVKCVFDGISAFKEAQRATPDVILSDAILPKMDGFALCKSVRKDARLSRVPTILISSIYLDEYDLQLGKNVAANAYVQKTPSLKELIHALTDSLTGNVPVLPPEDMAAIEMTPSHEVEQSHRVIRQLEQQVVINSVLAETSSVQAAQLSILVGASEVLTKTLDIGKVLREVLAGCLDAGGVSLGSAYLMDTEGVLSLQAQVGYSDAGHELLAGFFGHSNLLHKTLEADEVIAVPSPQISDDVASDLLKQAKAKFILLLPLILNEERLGVVSMVSVDRPIEKEQIAFANAVRGQVTQAVALSRTLSRIEYQSTHDPLTSLPNRVLLHDRLRQALLSAPREHKPLALFYIDLDHFKEVNDTLGHRHGDLLLQQVSLCIQGVLRASDTVARLGGDEFAILLPHVDIEGATLIAHKILKVLQAPLILDGLPVSIGASIGIAAYPDHGGTPDLLMQKADVAMYKAKERRHTYAVYSNDYEKHVHHRLASTEELNWAIDRGQLFLLYQPVIDCKTARVTGLEALVRWQHPRKGIVLPDQFITLAEQTGLINPLTVWTLNAALRQYQEWGQVAGKIHIAINLSVWKLHDARFPDQVLEMITNFGIEPSCLELEVTEASIMSDPIRTLEVLSRLQAMVVYVCIDDFGVGYSSLGAFRTLPVQAIKIDRTFVTDMMTHGDNAKIVRSATDLGHNLGLKVIADGVENQETWERLVELGCDAAQGFYMSHPIPPSECVDWLTQSPWGMKIPP